MRFFFLSIRIFLLHFSVSVVPLVESRRSLSQPSHSQTLIANFCDTTLSLTVFAISGIKSCHMKTSSTTALDSLPKNSFTTWCAVYGIKPGLLWVITESQGYKAQILTDTLKSFSKCLLCHCLSWDQLILRSAVINKRTMEWWFREVVRLQKVGLFTF